MKLASGSFLQISRAKLAIASGIVVAFVLGGAVAATTFSTTNSGDVEQHFITRDTATLVPATPGWHDVPNTTFSITVPDGKLRMAHLTFSGESRCSDASRCSMRAVMTSSENGSTIEMFPEAGTNFTFDSGGQAGARSFSRISLGLNGGGEGIKYTFKVQAQIIGPTATSVFRLDDYLTQLEISNMTLN